ncbi:putative histone-lysine N-methyltransferase PRDM6 isoform X2 [Actinia tenebrosa]|uniref:Histone-lysine N-methyltransferase PRDM6 isoform X2 n=1 Tax=Actinia tenebrosa TaxID=6105 RepID=A0A6P8HAK8_ACTTE|nr:putative histone-lysine N-methyltransferase PRDM6 isoform X2 [Actinia tenebrosa]
MTASQINSFLLASCYKNTQSCSVIRNLRVSVFLIFSSWSTRVYSSSASQTNMNVSSLTKLLPTTPYRHGSTMSAAAMPLLPSSPRYSFSFNELYHILYLQQEVEVIKMDDIKQSGCTDKNTSTKTKESVATCEVCRGQPKAECVEHGALSLPRKSIKPSVLKDIKLTYAISSFPDEVQLCCSSIPGAGYGVSAKQHIPIGTWIGPYEGKRIRPEDITNDMDTSYMWEIFQDGKLICYLDASDENTSSWMRFIRCARHRDEQNLYAFQYCGNIYYRAFRNISVGQELLVWYDDKYQQHMGLPLNIQDMAVVDPNGNNLLFDRMACNVKPPLSGCPQETSPVKPVTQSIPVPVTQHTPVHVSPQVSVDFTGQHFVPMKTPQQRPVNIVHRMANVPPRRTLPVTQSPVKVTQHSPINAVHPMPAVYPQKYPSGVISGPIKISANKALTQSTFAVTPRIHNSVTHSVTQPTSQTRLLPSPKRTHSFQDHRVSPPKEIKIVHSVHSAHAHHVHMNVADKALPSQEPKSSEREKSPPHPWNITPTNGELVVANDTNDDDQLDLTEESELSLWKCGQCQRSFTQRALLQIHICPGMANRPYKCGHCADSFSKSSELRTHVVRHTNEKPFKCGYCSRSFAGATTLNNHIRTHTGEKPFVCTKCKKMFSTASQLSRHQRIPAECI